MTRRILQGGRDMQETKLVEMATLCHTSDCSCKPILGEESMKLDKCAIGIAGATGQKAAWTEPGYPERSRGLLMVWMGALLSALLASALFAGTAGFQEYWIPGQESLLRAHMAAIDNDPAIGDNMHSVISVTAGMDGTVIHYDHWENGYGPADETIILNTGQSHLFESANIPANPRGTATYYDGGDRITVTGGPAFVTRASWPESPGPVMATAFNLLPLQAMSADFKMPVGYDLNQNNRNLPFADFQFVTLLVQSTRDNNAITIKKPDNTTIFSGVVNRGESVTSAALQSVLKGTTVQATYPVQLHFLIGRSVAGLEAQITGFTAVPPPLWSRKYLSPTPSFQATSAAQIDSRTDIYLYNPNSTSITVSYQDSSSGSFSIAAGELASFAQKSGHYAPRQSGVYLEGSGIFWGFAVSGTGYDSWNWGSTLIPAEYSRQSFYLGWAPGSLDGTASYSAAYIMALNANTTVNVDYDFDGVVDNSFNLDFPQVARIVDPNDRTLSGAHIYASDTLAITYGEISDVTTPRGTPALDLGYQVYPPSPELAGQVLSITKYAGGDTAVLNRPHYFALKVNSHDYPVGSINITDHLPANWQYVTNSSRLSHSNGGVLTPQEPLVIGDVSSGQQLYWNLAAALAADEYILITFAATPNTAALPGVNENCTEAVGLYNGFSFSPRDCRQLYLKDVAAVGNMAWNDTNYDGLQSASIIGVAEVTVELHHSSGTLLQSQVTGASGAYLFDDLTPGDYYLVFKLPPNREFSPQNQGSNEAIDSDVDPATGQTAVFSLVSGEINLNLDAGIHPVMPRIQIKKYVNGEDADVSAGPAIAVGDPVTWRYEVTNTGDVPLTTILVQDDQPGITPLYQSGDDGDNILHPGESWIYQATGTAAAGEQFNMGTATGSWKNQNVTDRDPSHYYGGVTAIRIEKYINGEEADLPPGPFITPGDPVAYSYIVTNTGTTAITDILVTDSQAEIVPVYLAGDDGDGVLDPGESWTFRAAGTAQAGQHSNLGVVNATDAAQRHLTDSDLAYYFGPSPAINLQKMVNSLDANVPLGPAVPVGQPVTWRYLVTNAGNVPLANITVSDDRGVVPDRLDVSPADGVNDGDRNFNRLLDLGETWSFLASGVATPGQYTNIGIASGSYNGQTISDTDPANYFGGTSIISIRTLTNGVEAQNPPGPGIVVGEPVTWRYEVQNTGRVPIRDVHVSDNQGVTVTAVDAAPADGFNDGDFNQDHLLDVNETWLFQASSTAQPGQYGNIATVTGIDAFTGAGATNSSPGYYFGAIPEIRLIKQINGLAANLPPGPTIIPGTAVTWQIFITNMGNVPLTQLSVTDSDPAMLPKYHTGDLDDDGVLDLDETWIYEADGYALSGSHTNVATVTARYVDADVQASDPCHYYGDFPRGRIGSMVWYDLNRNGIQETGAVGIENVAITLYQQDGTLVASTATDGDGEYEFTDILTGDYYLIFVPPSGWVLTQQNQGLDDAVDSDPDPLTGRTETFTLNPGQMDYTRNAGLFRQNPQIRLETQTNGEDADVPTGPAVTVGSTITWRYIVSNPGDVPFSGITVSDDQPGVSPAYLSGDDGDNLLEPGENWIYSASGTAVAGQHGNVGTATGTFNSQTYSSSDPGYYYGGQPGVQIKKYINGDDAESIPGPSITPGTAVTWTFIVTNTGSVAVSNLLVTDSQAGIVPLYQSGDDGNGLLDVGESWTYQAAGTAQIGQQGNTGTVNGTDALSQSVTDSDIACYFGPDPLVQIQKLANTDDANVAPGPAVPVGQTVLFTYFVTNTGNVPLSDIAVSDDRGLTLQMDDWAPADGIPDGDYNKNGLLDVNETWSYRASTPALAGQNTNIGTVTALYDGQTISDDDPANYYGGVMAISLRKLVNGEDANTAPGPGLIVGTPVSWRYEVRNLGNTPIRDLMVSDDQGVNVTAVDVAPADLYNDGDTDNDHLLDGGEVWLYQGSGTARAGQYINIGTVNGTDNLTGQQSSASDLCHYFGAYPGIQIIKRTNGKDANLAPGPTIAPGATVTWTYIVANTGNVPLENVKVTDSDPAVLPTYRTGDFDLDNLLDIGETWTFEAKGRAVAGQYANSGTVSGRYGSVTVHADDFSHYLSELPRGTIGNKVWNDLNRNGIQEPGAIGIEYVAVELHRADGALVATTVTNSLGEYYFLNVVSGEYYLLFTRPAGYIFTLQNQGGDPQTDSDADPVTGRTATFTLASGQTDNSHDVGYYKRSPQIQIEAFTNGEDADVPTGPAIPVGDAVTWRYEVSNPGDVALADIAVSDDAGAVPVYINGDDGDNLLEPGETWIYQATGTALPGQYDNMGKVTASFSGQSVSDSDPSHYYGGQPAVQLKKYVNGIHTEMAPGPTIQPGDPVTWIFIITNTGDLALKNILVSDSEPAINPVYQSGDDGNGLLDPGESWSYRASETAHAGQHINVGTINATNILNQPVSSSDVAYYFGPGPAIRLQKLANSEDANVAPGPVVPVGSTVVWTYFVDNEGNVPLANITCSDDQGVTPVPVDASPADGYNDGDYNANNLLDVGELWAFSASAPAISGQFTNTGTATGSYNGQTVSSSDPANYFGGFPGIDLIKSTNGVDADTPPGPGIVTGAAVTWRYEVRNLGNTPIREVSVSDDQGVTVVSVDTAPADGYNDGDRNRDNLLDTNEIWIYEGSGTAATGPYANIGRATGIDDLTGTPSQDADPSHYFGAAPAIDLVKRVNGDDANTAPGPVVIPAGSVTWQYLIINTGNVPLTTITVVDSDPAVVPLYHSGDVNNNNVLETDELWIFQAEGQAVTGQYSNTGVVSASYMGTMVQDGDPAHYLGQQPRGKIGNKVWEDVNRDGIQQPGAVGIENVTVRLHQSFGSLVAATITNSLGEYEFQNVAPGDYFLEFVTPAGYAFTLQNNGGDDAVDSDADPSTGRTATFTIAPGQSDFRWDAGLYSLDIAIHIETWTNGADADVPTGPSIPVGGTVTWRYEVTNPGNVALGDVSVTDNQPGVAPAYLSGDDGDGLLEPGESWIYQASGTAVAGQYANLGTAAGQYNSQTVSDSDPSHYFGGQAGIQIKKYVNGDDAEAPPGPSITPGSPVTWSYVVTNTGTTAINTVLVTDSEPGIAPAYLNGDDGNGLLDMGESWTYSAAGTARSGEYLNVGTVIGTDGLGQPVSDSDLAHYFGPEPSLQLRMLVNSEEADIAPGPVIPVGGTVTFAYLVSNSGNVPLADIAVTDDQGNTPAAIDLSPADGFNDGDQNHNNLLDLEEVWGYSATVSSSAGQHTITGSASGRYLSQTISDSDPANYFGGFAGIDLIKLTNEYDADAMPGPGILVGAAVTWRYEVHNLGNTPIRDITVSDNQGVTVTAVDVAPADGFNDGDLDLDNRLDVDEVWNYTGSGTAQPGQYGNIGTVTGIDDLTGLQTSDNDPSHYFGAAPAIELRKRTNGEDADVTPGPTIIPGGMVYWEYIVTNTGNVALGSISVSDSDPAVHPLYSAGDLNSNSLLDVGEIWVFSATGTALPGQYANIGTASGGYQGTTVQDDNASHYWGYAELDFGDLPDPAYPTLFASNGARHVLSPLYLGSLIDAEPDGQPSANATGDDVSSSDDEDGIGFPDLPLRQGKANTVTVLSSGSGYLNAWIDLNNDGDWNDAGEHIITDYAVMAGSQTITFSLPIIIPNAAPELLTLNARFRLASQSGLGVSGLALDGEVEDYQVETFVPVEIGAFSAKVVNGRVELAWTTESESENYGFAIFRSESAEGPFERISEQIIPGAGNSSQWHEYSYTDVPANGSRDYFYRLASISLDGTMQFHGTVQVRVSAPATYALEQNYPNPFNPTTTISFSLKEAGEVSLMIYNMRGQLIRRLVAQRQDPGFHTVVWDAHDDAGQPVPSGTYYYLLQVNGYSSSRRMTLIK